MEEKEEWLERVVNNLDIHFPKDVSNLIMKYNTISLRDLKIDHEFLPRDSLCRVHFSSYMKAKNLKNHLKATRIATHCAKVRLCIANSIPLMENSTFFHSCIPPQNNWNRDENCDCGNTAVYFPTIFRQDRGQRIIDRCLACSNLAIDPRWRFPKWVKRIENKTRRIYAQSNYSSRRKP